MRNKRYKGFYVYILKCSDDSYYTGYTENLFTRLKSHALGKENIYTSQRLPVKLVFYQKFETRYEALAIEKQIKGWNKKKKEALISNDFLSLRALSKNKSSKLSLVKEKAKNK